MASNGCVRSECDYKQCLFYEDAKEYGYKCTLRGELFDAENLRWVSANDCDRSPKLKKKYYEKCEHYTSINELKNQIRDKFGIDKVVYSR